MYLQVDIFGVEEVSQKKISTSLWSPNGGMFLKPVERYNMSSKEIPLISRLAITVKISLNHKLSFLIFYAHLTPLLRSLIHWYYVKKCSKVSWSWTGIKKHFILSEFSFKVKVRSTFSNPLLNCSITS